MLGTGGTVFSSFGGRGGAGEPCERPTEDTKVEAEEEVGEEEEEEKKDRRVLAGVAICN